MWSTTGIHSWTIFFFYFFFLVYVLPSSSKMLNLIMFADDTNLFYEHKNIKKLFAIVNEKIININDWFMANKLSLNIGKTKHSLFHKPSRVDDLPLKLPKLSINKQEKKGHCIQNFVGLFWIKIFHGRTI